MKRIKFIIVAVLALSVLAVPAVVLAEDTSSGDGTANVERETEKQKKLQEKQREQEKKKLERAKEVKKKACENRRESFKKRMENISERSHKRLEVFEKITERVQNFKTERNLTVANYDQLLADIEQKKEVVKQAQGQAKESAELFVCEGDKPKESVQAFKDALHTEIDAFKAYKDSIKKLIVAVKTAAEAASAGGENENQ